MNASRRLLLVFACACCLLVVATALPSADPRVDAPEGNGWEPVIGSGNDTDSGELRDDPERRNDTDPGNPDSGNNTDRGDPGDNASVDEPGDNTSGSSIRIEGALVPGTEVDIRVQVEGQGIISTPVTVDGRPVGESATGYGEEASYEVPYSEERITVSAPEVNVTETFRVETDASITASARRLPGRGFNLTAEVGGERVPGAAVDVNGEEVAVTDGEGRATVEFPETATVVNVSVRRGVVTGERALESSELEVSMSSMLLFPGLPTAVQVTAGGEPVANATVEAGGNTAETGENGQATVRLPVSDRVTVTATVGSEQATVSVAGLYWRLTAVVGVVPSVLVGLLAAYRRFVCRARRQRHASLFHDIGKALSNLFTTAPTPGRSGRRRMGGWLSWPSLSWPSLPSFELTVPSLSWWLPSLDGRLSGDDTDTQEQATGEQQTSTGSESASGDRTPEQQIGRGWHQFVEHLDVERPETRTPGQVARRALAAGYPGQQVRMLVETFRAVEYGGREVTRERVERIVETSRALLEHREEES